MLTYKPPINTGLVILYQDDTILIVNKPSGLLSVPGRGVDKQDCMVSRINLEYPAALSTHRLDMSTSGILVLALNKDSQKIYNALFATQEIHKSYIAVVNGILKFKEGEINQPLICDWPNRPRQIIDDINGKKSLTNYKVLELYEKNKTSRVELQPKTGRTHQLRVHLQFLGHAILGDELYGSEVVKNKSKRLLLHASSMEFQHPITGLKINIECPTPF